MLRSAIRLTQDLHATFSMLANGITQSLISSLSTLAPTGQWRSRLQDFRNRIAHGQLWGLAWSLGQIMDVLAFLCVLRVKEHEEAGKVPHTGVDDVERPPEFPDAARWETLRSVQADQLAAYIETELFPRFRSAPASSPLRLLTRLFQPDQFPAEVYQAAMAMLSSPALPFQQYLELERDGKSMGLEDKAAELFSGWSGVGEFITPTRVADLMIDLAAPQPGERIYNPCMGFGTLLVRTAKRIILPGLQESSPLEAERVLGSTIFGVELNASVCLMALARLMLAGVTRPHLDLGDVLDHPDSGDRENGGFDVILCNPPFGSAAAPEQMSNFPVRSRSAETLVLQYVLSQLRPGGRAVVLMPEAFLYRQGPEETLRRRLLLDFRLEAVVALPEGAIPGLGELRTSLLVIRRQEPLKNVVFVPAKTAHAVLSGYRAGLRKNTILPQLLAAIAGTEAEGESSEEAFTKPDGPARLVVNREHVDALADRQWELVSKSRGADKLQILLDAIQRTEAKMAILRLGDAGSVSSGMSYRRTDMVEENAPRAKDEVCLVRVRDLANLRGPDSLKLVVTPTMARMTAEGAQRAARHTHLQSGDILLTVVGTVGKVAVVGEGGPRLVAASGVNIIRVRDAALARYLPRLLTTEPYQDWLWRRSTGTSLTRLQVRDVEQIPVPLFTGGVPPEAVGYVSVGQSLDGIIRLLESKPRFSASVRFLLDEPLVRSLGDKSIEGLTFGLTPKGLRSLLPPLQEVLREGTIDEGIESLHDWLHGFHDFTLGLLDILDLPVGPERFSSLQAWRFALDASTGEFQKAREELRKRARNSRRSSDPPPVVSTVHERAEALLEALLEVWRLDYDAHLGGVRLSATLAPAMVAAGAATELSVVLTNDGALPLRKLSFETRPFESRDGCNLLRTGASHHWPVQVTGSELGKRTIVLHWTGQRMDGSETSGEVELAFEVVSSQSTAHATRLEKSPYVVGSPLDPKSKVFFGRDDLIARISRTLRVEGPSTVILLEGNRRAGKSSLLRRLTDGALPADWMPVYVNFQAFDGKAGKPGMATQEIFYGIAKELVVAAARATPDYRVPGVETAVPTKEGMEQTAFSIRQVRPLFETGNSFEVFRLVVESMLAAVEPRRVLLMLDEFDKIQEGIDAGITSPQLPENLRNLFHTYERVSGVLTGSRTIRRLRQEYWHVLFGLGIPIPIKGLDDAAARRLITEPVTGQLVYTPSAVDFVVERCARQPFLLQGLCHSIFELCASTQERTVTVEMAGNAVARYVEGNEHFRFIWNQIGSPLRQYLVCLVDELASQEIPVTLEFLWLTLEQRGVAYQAIKDLTEDLEELLTFEILGTEGDHRQRTYRIEVPIFSDWLRKSVDGDAHRLEAINAVR